MNWERVSNPRPNVTPSLYLVCFNKHWGAKRLPVQAGLDIIITWYHLVFRQLDRIIERLILTTVWEHTPLLVLIRKCFALRCQRTDACLFAETFQIKGWPASHPFLYLLYQLHSIQSPDLMSLRTHRLAFAVNAANRRKYIASGWYDIQILLCCHISQLVFNFPSFRACSMHYACSSQFRHVMSNIIQFILGYFFWSGGGYLPFFRSVLIEATSNSI